MVEPDGCILLRQGHREGGRHGVSLPGAPAIDAQQLAPWTDVPFSRRQPVVALHGGEDDAGALGSEAWLLKDARQQHRVQIASMRRQRPQQRNAALQGGPL